MLRNLDCPTSKQSRANSSKNTEHNWRDWFDNLTDWWAWCPVLTSRSPADEIGLL